MSLSSEIIALLAFKPCKNGLYYEINACRYPQPNWDYLFILLSICFCCLWKALTQHCSRHVLMTLWPRVDQPIRREAVKALLLWRCECYCVVSTMRRSKPSFSLVILLLEKVRTRGHQNVSWTELHYILS